MKFHNPVYSVGSSPFVVWSYTTPYVSRSAISPEAGLSTTLQLTYTQHSDQQDSVVNDAPQSFCFSGEGLFADSPSPPLSVNPTRPTTSPE